MEQKRPQKRLGRADLEHLDLSKHTERRDRPVQPLLPTWMHPGGSLLCAQLCTAAVAGSLLGQCCVSRPSSCWVIAGSMLCFTTQQLLGHCWGQCNAVWMDAKHTARGKLTARQKQGTPSGSNICPTTNVMTTAAPVWKNYSTASDRALQIGSYLRLSGKNNLLRHGWCQCGAIENGCSTRGTAVHLRIGQWHHLIIVPRALAAVYAHMHVA